MKVFVGKPVPPKPVLRGEETLRMRERISKIGRNEDAEQSRKRAPRSVQTIRDEIAMVRSLAGAILQELKKAQQAGVVSMRVSDLTGCIKAMERHMAIIQSSVEQQIEIDRAIP